MKKEQSYVQGELELGPALQNKRIIIIEGPAGSGKTYLCEKAKALGFPVISGQLPVRNPPLGEAPFLSLLNDTEKIAKALLLPDPVVIIDRCLLSQYVYRKLRLRNLTGPAIKKLFATPLAQTWFLRSSEFLDWVSEELWWRAEDSDQRLKRYATLTFWVLLPSVEVITERRAKSGRPYHWPPELERAGYEEVAKLMFGTHIIEDSEDLRIFMQALDLIKLGTEVEEHFV